MCKMNTILLYITYISQNNQTVLTNITYVLIQIKSFVNKCIRNTNIIVFTSKHEVGLMSWYWTWSESAVFDFIVSTFLNRSINLMLFLLSFTSIVSFIEFSLYFSIASLSNIILNIYKLYGSKYAVLTVLTVWMFFISLIISVI